MAVWGSFVWGNGAWGDDGSAPSVTPVSPTATETGVTPASDITLEITDASNIALGTVAIRVDISDGSGYQTVFEGYGSPQFKSGWDGPRSSVTAIPSGYSITIDPVPTLPGDTVIWVEVTAEDTTGIGA